MSLLIPNFSAKILAWFNQHGRHDLPWQQLITPYRVWVSEIMLQQTQAQTVIPYFLRFMTRFPTLEILAHSPIDDVLQHWAGLGYYARARNLHRTAEIVWQEYHGELPRDLALLQQLPGIGRSTAGAIAAMSMGIAAPILDGNVKRVLCRVHAIADDPKKTATIAQLWQLASGYTPQTAFAEYTQAMMDLGALLCTPREPKCHQCPLMTDCRALKTNQVALLPQKNKRKKLPVKQAYFLLAQNEQDEIFLLKRPPIGIWGGLWSLPELPGLDLSLANEAKCFDVIHRRYGLKIKNLTTWPVFRHTFTHFHLDITPIKMQVVIDPLMVREAQNVNWCSKEKALDCGLPTPVRRCILQL